MPADPTQVELNEAEKGCVGVRVEVQMAEYNGAQIWFQVALMKLWLINQ